MNIRILVLIILIGFAWAQIQGTKSMHSATLFEKLDCYHEPICNEAPIGPVVYVYDTTKVVDYVPTAPPAVYGEAVTDAAPVASAEAFEQTGPMDPAISEAFGFAIRNQANDINYVDSLIRPKLRPESIAPRRSIPPQPRPVPLIDQLVEELIAS